ncbi:MAG: polysaccharide deacetylase family protein [Bacteroidales bacterium]|nr:polysaccharide deacetylase family protein [Bacteroidales bacterium]
MKLYRLEYLFVLLTSFLLLTSTISSCIRPDDKSEEKENSKKTWAKKLSYPPGKKVLVLHADDAGMCNEANEAIKEMLEKDWIQSTAVMMPCPAAEPMIRWAKDHPGEDVGLHLTHTSEWETWRWGSVSDPDEVPGLIDPEGKLWDNVPQVVEHATAEEVEKEIRAQIEKAIELGYKPDHIDTHMGTLYATPEYVKAFFSVAEEYGIPANVIDLSDPRVADKYREQGYPINEEVIQLVKNYSMPKVDNFTSVPKGSTYEEKVANFKELVRNLRPGLTEIIFHPSVQSENLKNITGSWQQRVWEKEMFGDPELQDFFKQQGIIFANWKEIMKRFRERKNNHS